LPPFISPLSMKKYLLGLVLLIFAGMRPSDSSPRLYQSEAFTLYADRVVQGDFEAKALSPTHLVSNYRSTAHRHFSRLITFKVAINEKDVELPSGQDHWVLVGEEAETPVIQFGERPAPMPAAPDTFLPVNYRYTFRLDMSPVMEQFEAQGYFEAYDGTRIAQSDFKGFFLAGGSAPLSWDFSNLAEKGLKLEPTGEGHIYALSVTLNPYDAASGGVREWQPTLDLSAKPRYESDQPLVDALFNLSLEEALMNIEADSTLRTGAKWGGVWTRDISYSILLAFAYHEPEIARISLMKKVQQGRIIQDTGSGGAWPVSSDRTTWALAAWELYKTTGDRAWLRQAYEVIQRSLAEDARVLAAPENDLYRGESSFLDWREQTYPRWMDNRDIYVSQNLGTNVVHYQAHRILGWMAEALGEPANPYASRADDLKQAINEQLWMEEEGYYAQYLYGREHLYRSPRFEALGEALAVLFEVADEQQARRILGGAPLTEFGTTCIYPQIPGIPPYHNNGIWPFVQAYWNLAAAKVGNESALEHGLASIYRAAGLFLTNYENMVARNGDYYGTEINSHRMLWSMAGNLAMVHRVFMGLNFEPDGLRFAPVVPASYPGTKRLSNFRYREANLDITVQGTGREIARITLDGKPLAEAFLPANLQGKHAVHMLLSDAPLPAQRANRVANHFSLPTPQVSLQGPALHWAAMPEAASYRLYRNGKLLTTTQETTYAVATDDPGEYVISAVDAQGYESFVSEPLSLSRETRQVPLERIAPMATLPFTGYEGKGFVEIATNQNQHLDIPIEVEQAGTYRLDFRYANGSGPWNTDNKCALRSLYVNGAYQGAVVFPQRGKDEWSDWGYSNGYELELPAGEHLISLTFEPWNHNMNLLVNRAMLDYLRLVRVGG
jgi:hypothetical protein